MSIDTGSTTTLGRLLPADLRELLRAHGLRLQRPVWGRRHGRHPSKRAGTGLDFRDHRPYVPGDEPRMLDWRAAARRDRLVLRQTESEVELSCMLLVDHGATMAYGEGMARKSTVVDAVAGALAWLAVRQGDRVGLLLGRDGEMYAFAAYASDLQRRAAYDLIAADPPEAAEAAARAWDRAARAALDAGVIEAARTLGGD